MMTSGSIVRPLLGLALPYAVSGLLGMLNVVIDRFWVGKVGTDALAALGTAQSLLLVMMTVLMGMAIGTLAGVARAVGQGRPQDASRFSAGGLLVGFGLGSIFLVAGFLHAPTGLMHLIDAAPSVREPATAYLRISMWGLSVLGPLFSIVFALQGAGDARRSLILSSVSPVTNAILDPLLIFTFGMGMPGAAWATVVANGVGLAAGLFLLHRRGGFLSGGWRREWLDLAVIRRIVVVGIPGSLEHLVRTVAGASLVYLLTPFGASVVSAYTAGNVLVMMAIFPGLSLGQATASLVGQNLGAEKPERAWKTAWVSVGIYLSVMLVCAALFSIFAQNLVGIFDDNPAVMREGARFLHIFSFSFPFIAIALILSKAFSGAGNTKPPMVAAAIAHLAVQVPLVWYLARHYSSGGAYLGMTIAFVVHASGSVLLFIPAFAPARGERRRRPATRKREVAPPATSLPALGPMHPATKRRTHHHFRFKILPLRKSTAVARKLHYLLRHRTWRNTMPQPKHIALSLALIVLAACSQDPSTTTDGRFVVKKPGTGKNDSYVNTAAKEYAFTGTAHIVAPANAETMEPDALTAELKRKADSRLRSISQALSSKLREKVSELNNLIPHELPAEIAEQIKDEDDSTKRKILENWRTQQEVSAFSRSSSTHQDSIRKTEDGRYAFDFKLEFVLSNKLAEALFPDAADGSGTLEVIVTDYYDPANTETLAIAGKPTPSTDAFPKYNEMFSDGVFDVAIHIGGDYNSDEVKICCPGENGEQKCEKKTCANSCNNDSNACTEEPPAGCTKELIVGRIDRYTAEHLVASLKADGFQHEAETYKDLEIDSPPFEKRIQFDTFELLVRVKIVFPEIVPCGEERKLVDAMKESLRTADMIVYAGHAGPGAGFLLDYQPRTELDDAEWKNLEMPAKYQMVFMYGCETYSTYADALFANPNKNDGNLDVVTTANTMWTNMGLPGTLTVFNGLLVQDTNTKKHIPVSWNNLLMWLNTQAQNGHTHYGVHGVDSDPKVSPWSDTSGLCSRCETDSDCPGGGNFCITYGDGSKGCGLACTTDAGCGDGYQCYRIPGTEDSLFPKICVPQSFSCQP